MRISNKIAMTWLLTGILLISALCNCKIVSSQHPNGKNEKWQTLLTAGLLNGYVNSCSSGSSLPSQLTEMPTFSGSNYTSSNARGNLLYVSITLGNDANNGSLPEDHGLGNGPFKTIATAITKAKSIRASQLDASPITLLIREGTYYLDQTLVVDLPKFTIMRYPGEHPIISGGRKLSGWGLTYANRNPQVWSTRVPGSGDLVSLSHNLWVDGQWAVKARYPKNDHYFSSPELDSDDFWMYSDSGKLLVENNPDLDFVNIGFGKWPDAVNWNISGSEIFIYEQAYDLRNYSLEGRRMVNQNRYFAFYGPASTILTPTRFFVANVFEMMTNEGEWFLDQKERCQSQGPECGRWIFYMPKGGKNPNDSLTVVSAISPLLTITGEDIIVDGITFSDTALPDYSAVDILGGNNVTIANCFFRNLTGSGVNIGASSQSVTILRNVFSDIGMIGIHIGAVQSMDFPTKNIIQGNYIIRSGLMGGQSSGAISVHGSNENIILENQVDHSRFVGISVGIHIPANNVFISSQRNAITGNEIVYSGISSADQSGIYVGGHGRPGADLTSNWITENRVLQSIGSMRTAIENVAGIEHKGVDGIFLDDYSSGNLVQRNIVSNSSRSSIHINMGAKNRIYQNILASDTDSSVHTNLGAEENEFYGNHVIDLAAQPASKVWSNDSGTSQMGFNRIDGNLYWLRGRDPSWPDTFSGFSPIGTFRQWRSTGTFDLNSRYVTDNLGVVISPDRVVLGNASCSWAAANGYGPSFGILTGLRRFVAQRNDLSATCINSLFGNQYSPNFNVNPVSVYKCLVP